MLDLAAIDVVGGGRGVGDSVMNNVGDSTNAAASCLDAISAAGAGSVLAHHLAFSPESLLVKPNEVVCIPSAIEPPTNFVSDEDDENDEYDEVEEDDDDEQEIEEKRTTGIEFEYRLRSSKAAAATRAPPPTAYNTTPLSSPDSVPSFANIISTAASPTNLYSASSLSSCSTSSNRERVSSLSSTTSLDQFRSQLMIVKLNFLKRKKISPSPLPASVAPIPAIFDMEANGVLILCVIFVEW